MLKSLNSVGGFSVRDSLTGNLTVIIDNVGNVYAPNLSITGLTDLGQLSNVRITGGNPNYVIATDGTGNLSWVPQSGGGGGNTYIASPMPYLINAGETFYVTENHQGLFNIPIQVDGSLQIDGILVEV